MTQELIDITQTQLDTTAPVRALIADHLGVDPLGIDVITELYEAWDEINVQAALEAYIAAPGRSATVLGVSVPPPVGGGSVYPPEVPELGLLVAAVNPRIGAAEMVDVESGPDEVKGCYRSALLLIHGPEGPLAVWVRPDSQLWGRKIGVDVQGRDDAASQAFLRELRDLKTKHNLFRGQLVRFVADTRGNITISFDPRPKVQRHQVILPKATIDAVDRHAIGISAASDDLRLVGRHLKRGLLLYGPPGTGKTLTIRYLATSLERATVFILTGTAMAWLRFVTELALELEPAMIVLDDVDLIAEDRDLGGMSPRRHLFDLLDAMDGLHEDADVLFVATTNRPESLEKAISARPGRIDQALEIRLPDAECRERLIDLYAEGLDLRLEDIAAIVQRTEGVTSSFVKELLRKAAMFAVMDSPDDQGITVTDRHVHAALDALLDPTSPLTASLLGGGPAVPDSPSTGATA